MTAILSGQVIVLPAPPRPAINITCPVSSTNAPFTATFTFTDPVTLLGLAVTGFTLSGISVANGVASAFTTVNGFTYTALITANSDGNVIVNVAENTGYSLALQGNTPSNNLTVAFDGTRPSVVLTSPSGTVSGPVTITATFSEAVTGFDLTDVAVANATKSAFTTVNAYTYTFLATPTGGTPITVNIAQNVCVDLFGNQNTAATQLSIIYNAVVVTLAITTNDAQPVTTVFTAIFTFSEVVAGFDTTDITATHATKGTLSTSDNITFTQPITPDGSGNIVISVPAGAATGAHGANLLPNPLTVTYQAAADYTTNIYDSFVPNRGIVPTADSLTVSTWSGIINLRKLTQLGTPAIPANAVMTFTLGQGFLLPTASNPSIVGAASFDFKIQKTSATSGIVDLLDTNTNVPRLKFYLRISVGNPNVGISYNGITYDAGFVYPYDASIHNMSLCVDGTNNVATIYLDTVLKATITITGGQLNCNTGQVLGFFRNAVANSEQFAGTCKGFRIYNEYHSAATITILHTGSWQNDIVDNTNLIEGFIWGQSNVGPPLVSDNTIGFYDATLQNGFADVEMWDYVNLKWIPIPGSVSTLISGGFIGSIKIGEILKIAYDLRAKFPGYKIRLMEYYLASTPLANTGTTNWVATNTLYKNWKNNALCAMVVDTLEQRNLVKRFIFGSQGEQDSLVLADSNNYPANIIEFYQRIRVYLGATTLAIHSLVSTRISSSFPAAQVATVRNGQIAWAATDATNNKTIDTENASLYPYSTGNIHYNPTGQTNIGAQVVTYVNYP